MTKKRASKQKMIYGGKNILPLLAITVLVLSFSLISYQKNIVSNNRSKQAVLSDFDEKETEDDRRDDKEEDRNNNETREIKNKSEEERRESERIEIRNNDETENSSMKSKKMEIVRIEDKDEDNAEYEADEMEDQELEIEQESETELIDGTVNRFKLKIKTRTVAGKTIVETAKGEMEVEKDPNEVINNLVKNGLLDTPISFEAKANNSKIEYEIQGTDSKRLLGIFEIVIPKLLTVSAETGEVVSSGYDLWPRFLNLLSI